MMNMLFGGGYYYIPLILEALCAIHCLRRGTQQKWLWIIIFLPVIGSCIYIYSEILTSRSGIRIPKVDVGAVLNPGVKLKRLEEELRFTDTFANKTKLADAYLDAGFVDKAVELYQNSLTGAFAENEHVLAQLIVAYYEQGRYAEIIPIAKKLYKLPQFARSKAHMKYALALENTGEVTLAESEFKAMKGRYSYFEPRYEYGLFLVRQGRYDDAHQIFTDILNEVPQLSAMERRINKVWFGKAKDELRRLSVQKMA
ncbi:tetratricopeptide repeat protein [Mucilaginibacter sp. FT3.2]|uniref:tetratricopeptide repeat protein n=1 Tax=Mucilaginibacter sp. FT3.2 TaxID=2723090 RepID=UPI00183B9443|nr:tetratricopeptide repeat protein [Mucilaginibacter sp. FT3.2]MBB6235057.1 hypothetical protein [Mucilaginibacter sp. FT3.2]